MEDGLPQPTIGHCLLVLTIHGHYALGATIVQVLATLIYHLPFNGQKTDCSGHGMPCDRSFTSGAKP